MRPVELPPLPGLNQLRVVLGVCYHSATVLGPGHVLHAGQGKTFMGELDGSDSARLQQIVRTFNDAGIVVDPAPAVRVDGATGSAFVVIDKFAASFQPVMDTVGALVPLPATRPYTVCTELAAAAAGIE